MCPYCSKDSGRFCVPLPNNTLLENGILVPRPGFRIVNGIITHAAVDNSEEYKRQEKAGNIIKMLESYKGEVSYKYGSSDYKKDANKNDSKINAKLQIDKITSDERIKELLIKSDKLIYDGFSIEAKKGRVSCKLFLRYYFIKCLKFICPMTFIIIMIKLFLWRRKIESIREKNAQSKAKDAIAIIAKQLIMNSRSDNFNPFVYEHQLRDILDVKLSDWKRVSSILSSNSNIKTDSDECGRKILQWIGPAVYTDSNI